MADGSDGRKKGRGLLDIHPFICLGGSVNCVHDLLNFQPIGKTWPDRAVCLNSGEQVMQLADFHIHITKAVASVWQKGGIRLMQWAG